MVVTVGSGSFGLYSQKLAEKLVVPKFYTDIYQRIRERFNIPWFSKEALKAIHEDFKTSHSSNFNYPYILFVGSEHHRTNLPILLKAFKKLKKQTRRTKVSQSR